MLSSAGEIDPRAREKMVGGLEELGQQLGIELREDLLKTIGDVWCIYNSPSEGGLLGTGITGVVQVRDRQRLDATHKRLQAKFRAELETAEVNRRPRRRPLLREFEFAGQTVHFFDARDDDIPLAPAS